MFAIRATISHQTEDFIGCCLVLFMEQLMYQNSQFNTTFNWSFWRLYFNHQGPVVSILWIYLYLAYGFYLFFCFWGVSSVLFSLYSFKFTWMRDIRDVAAWILLVDQFMYLVFGVLSSLLSLLCVMGTLVFVYM